MKIAILTGETSGDNYGSLLAKKIKSISPETIILSTGGSKMKVLSDIFIDMPLGKMGFSGVIKSIGAFYNSYKKVVKLIEQENPSLIIFIDNPGFNLKVAKALKGRYKTLYYIPPKIWAHNYNRIKTIKKYIQVVIPIFSFEREIYEKEDVECYWFGHPATDLIKQSHNTERKTVREKDVVVGLLPGSREEEIKYLLPEFLKIIKKMRKERKLKFLLSASDKNIKKKQELMLAKYDESSVLIKEDLYEIIDSSDMLFAASGTVNIEIALKGKPFLVFYKTTFLNYFLAKMIVKLKYISPVNLILNQKVVPEYIQVFPHQDIVKTSLNILTKKTLYKKQIKNFEVFKNQMNDVKVSEKVAMFILSNMENQ
ncbi:lipid-A-disaccharide synthase [bacterium]|nr:lipid-A-disaccharide synthase [bacterium]